MVIGGENRKGELGGEEERREGDRRREEEEDSTGEEGEW